MKSINHHPGELSSQVKTRTSLTLVALSTLSACVPYPHSVTKNPVIVGRVLTAATGQAVANAKIELDIGSDESWSYKTVSDTEGRFVFTEHRDYRVFALLADTPHCWITLSISAPGYRTRRCGWMGMHGCSSAPMRLPRLTLQQEHIAAPEEEVPDNLWRCIESAMEQAN